MSHDNPNQCGYYEQETIPCDLCGTPTPMTGTRRCDLCWELERRVEQRPEVARKLVAAMTAIDPNAATHLITRLTEALRNVTVAIIAIQDSPDVRFSTETKKAIREADALIRAAIAKERAL